MTGMVAVGDERRRDDALRTRVALQCLVTRECPADWQADLQRCDGGFFHSPLAIDLDSGGQPLFARIVAGSEVLGISLGIQRPCRLALAQTPRHVYFPTLPALAPGVSGSIALGALIAALKRLHAAEVVMESFDASWNSVAGEPSSSRAREEYVIPLDRPAADRWEALSTGHRRNVRKGDRAGWRIDAPTGDVAGNLLTSVQEGAARRAAERGSGFTVKVPSLRDLAASTLPWGATLFAAWRDDVPLAAALVGWANRRSFYVMGGSTPAGYECGAAIWLHWQIGSRLAEAGFTAYNLGAASDNAGLRRFKIGFGSNLVPCRSMAWTLRPAHARLHQIGRWFTASPFSSRDT